MRRYVLSLAVLALLITVVGQAHANLIGTEVEYTYVIDPFTDDPNTPLDDDINKSETNTVDGAVEFDTGLFGLASLDVDVGALSTLSISFGVNVISPILLSGDFNGPVLTSLDWGDDPAAGEIIGFTLNTNISDLDKKRVFPSVADALSASGSETAGPHSIAVNLSGLNINPGQFSFDITLLVSHPVSDLGSQPIPEPGTLLLIGSGLVGIGVGARRRNRRK